MAAGDDFASVWSRALEALDDAGVSPQQKAFVRLTRLLGVLDGTALLSAPNDFTRDVLEQRLRQPITEALTKALGTPIRLAVMVDTTATGSEAAPAGGQAVPGGRIRKNCAPN